MAKVGYIYRTKHCDGLDEDVLWMKDYGCAHIVEEAEEQEVLRPQWKQMLPHLERGDELVVAKLSNALRGSRELSLLMEFCRTRGIRLISIRDRIDSGDTLFPTTRVSDVLNVFGQLPFEVIAMRNASMHTRRLKSKLAAPALPNVKLERNKRVVNMYRSGYSIDEIWKASGFHSRSSVFRILKEAGVKQRHNWNNDDKDESMQ